MFRPFRLKRPIGPESVMDRDDVLTTKRALNALGYLEAPDFGLTPFPDDLMINAIRGFQRRHKLRVDGVMNPDGPTLDRLNQAIVDRRRYRPSPKGPLMPVIPKSYSVSDTYATSANQRSPRRSPPSVFHLTGGVGDHRRNNPRDILAIEGALASTGYHSFRNALGGSAGRTEIFEGLKNYQRANGLKADGWAGPSGETETALNRSISLILATVDKAVPAQASDEQADISDKEKDLCDDRYRRELQRCSRLPGMWHGPCAQRATIRWASCYKYGYPPGSDREPPEWGPGDMEQSFDPKK